MISRVHGSILQGIDAIPCEIEVDVVVAADDEPCLKLVGMADQSVKESISRVQSALRNSGFRWPGTKVTINLAPADVRKDSAAFDLPIALAALRAGGQMDSPRLEEFVLIGELALDGRVRPIRGALATAMMAQATGRKGVVVPADNAAEAAVVEGVDVIGVTSLSDAVAFLTGVLEIEPTRVDLEAVFAVAGRYEVDFGDVRGQESAKRALTVAAAGHHNLLMIGPPGSGKTMLAKRIPTILPPLSPEESLETTRIYSSRGLLAPGQSLMAIRPVRTPHHSSSSAALVGGGIVPQPGEISLAHHGVLFLDEFPEFNRTTLEMIRQPLEDGCVTIPRVHSTLKFPASIMLVAAMNPCPCGYATDPKRKCNCGSFVIERYLGRVSGPLIDRIDIHIEVPPVSWKQLRADGAGAEGLTSEQMRQQVMRARETQRERFGAEEAERAAAEAAEAARAARAASQPPAGPGDGPLDGPGEGPLAGADSGQAAWADGQAARPLAGVGRAGFYPGQAGASAGMGGTQPPPHPATEQPAWLPRGRGTITNATMSSRQVRKYCKLDSAGEALLKQAVTELGLSARAHDKVLRIARTIADLEGCPRIQTHHLAEAIQYRRLDRKL